MQVRRSVFLFIVIVAALIALILWHGRKPPVETPPTAAVATNTAPPVATTPSTPVTVPVHTNTPAAKAAAATTLPKPVEEGKNQRMREILAEANDVPIIFYGRLEDQFSNPVAGAEITGTTAINNGTQVGANRVVVTSDNNGFFQLNAGNGESLGIMPRKTGYAPATTGTEFNYSHLAAGYYVPDPNSPTVIKMWKLQGAEPLVGINQHYKLPYTSTPINFDLLAGKIVPEGGDIQLTVNRAAGVISGRNRLDWGVQVAAVNGGVMDSGGQERVTYAAPEDGYQPSMTFMFSTNAPYKWFGGFRQGFFVESRSGQVYSKVGLSFNINNAADGLMSVTFSGVANANGSRNWEGDGNTMKAVVQ
jgi:hypothetical protein